MNSFDHMVMALNKTTYDIAAHKIEVDYSIPFKPLHDIDIKISESELEEFMKDFTFDKLKGRKLSECFRERFQVSDTMLSLGITDDLALEYIKRYYVE